MNITAQAAIQQITDTLYAPVRYTGSGSPVGVIKSDPGWFYRDTVTGSLWVKESGTGNSGWKLLSGLLFSNVTAVQTTGAHAETLQENTIASGIIKGNGDIIKFGYAGTIGSTFAGAVRFKLAGTIVQDITSVPNSTVAWTLNGRIIRATSSSLLLETHLSYGVDSAITRYEITAVYTITNSIDNSFAMGIYANSATASSFSKNFGWAEFIPYS